MVSPRAFKTLCQYFFIFIKIIFFRATPGQMQVPTLGVKPELQLQSYTTATATRDLSCICNLYRRSWQHQLSNPLSEARDQTATSWFLVGFVNHWATMRTPYNELCKTCRKRMKVVMCLHIHYPDYTNFSIFALFASEFFLETWQLQAEVTFLLLSPFYSPPPAEVTVVIKI